MAKKVIICRLLGSKTDFSKQNRCEIMSLTISNECGFEIPDIGDTIEVTIGKEVKKIQHFLVTKIEQREDPIAIFVEKKAEGEET